MSEDQGDARLIEIANRLLKSTRAGSIRWKTSDREQAFVYSGSNSSVLIRSHLDMDGDELVNLSILNPRGTVVAEIGSGFDESTETWATSRYKPRPQNQLLSDLHEAARRNALQIDEVLDSIFRDLD